MLCLPTGEWKSWPIFIFLICPVKLIPFLSKLPAKKLTADGDDSRHIVYHIGLKTWPPSTNWDFLWDLLPQERKIDEERSGGKKTKSSSFSHIESNNNTDWMRYQSQQMIGFSKCTAGTQYSINTVISIIKLHSEEHTYLTSLHAHNWMLLNNVTLDEQLNK